ncbi:ATP-binding protein [Bacillus tuaregi]|uniref:ATP-binding protein n=1 Tax=Bacillus tuaregi TaxID=1816695 RepID=UPI0008F94928|nr:sensor histidine kinase [Bacillus tuaregi]
MKLRSSIQWKMTSLIIYIVWFSLVLLGVILIGQFLREQEYEVKERSLLTARTVAELPNMIDHLGEQPDADSNISRIIERLRIINNADYIVILNMERIRLTHPNAELIGTPSTSADEGPSFTEHSYTSKAKGEIGTVIRAFVPIMNNAHQQIGVVIVGYKLPGILAMLSSLKMQLFLTAGITLAFSAWGAWILARHIKRQMFKLEPEEIARILVERTESFNAMQEGIIAIDNNQVITIFNEKAKKMLGVEGEVIGREVTSVLPDSYLPEILEINKPVYNKDLHIRNLAIVSNRIPIKVNGNTVGAIAVFQDRTEVKKLAEELTGVKAFVGALRAQNHEHMNKLHTIAGLIQLGKNDKALEYVFEATEEQGELTRFLSSKIGDDSLVGLLIGKVSRGRELGIHVEIDRHSILTRFPKLMDQHDFVLILGNLIENAFDSFKNSPEDSKQIYVSIQENDKLLNILVEDNGCGIEKDKLPLIFKEGYTSKISTTGRGIGLYLIKQIVEKGNGVIHVESRLDEGTTFSITFEMGDGE